VKPSEVAAFLAQFSGASNHNSHLEVLRSVFDLAKKDGIIGTSPVEEFKYRKRKTPTRRTPTFEEFRAIVQNIREQSFADTAEESADVVEFYGLAGLGKAEVNGLLWPDIQFERGQITIKFRLKTGAGFVIPIYPQARPLLERRYKAAQERFQGRIPATTAVFCVADPKKAIDAACKRLSLPKFSGRSFRRMFITTAIERGVDVKVIAQWQGHKDGGKLILDTYSHVRPVHSERMALLMVENEPENVVQLKGAA
jgi:integrase